METNCNKEEGKERNKAVAVEEVRSGVALKKNYYGELQSYIKVDVTHCQKTHSQCNLSVPPLAFPSL